MIKRFVFVLLAAVVTFTGFGATSASASSLSDKVITAGKAQLGTPYAWGGTSPSGFDCSGFVQYAFAQAGISLSRTTSSQYNEGVSVSRSNLEPGDIVFFNTSGNGVSHDGIYIGDNQFIHSSSSYGISIASMSNSYWGPRYIGAKRIITSASEVKSQQTTSNRITVELNGRLIEFDKDPILTNGTTLVPVRAIYEALGADVGWNPANRTVTGSRGNTDVLLTIDSKRAYINNQAYTLLEPAIILNSRTFIPVRFISESLGAKVEWDQQQKRVIITD